MPITCSEVTESFTDPNTVRRYMEEARTVIQDESDRIFYNDIQSFWLTFVQTGTFQLRKGFTQQIKERTPSFIPPDLPWKDVTSLVEEGRACTICPYEIRFGSNFREVKLETLEIRGPDICYIELLELQEFEKELMYQYEELASARQVIYENRYRDAYITMASRKYLMAQGLPWTEPGNTFPNPTGLTVGKAHESMLARVASIFNNTGGRRAGQNMGMDRGAPLYGMIARQEVFDDILRNDEETRKDIRETPMSTELLKKFHLNMAYKQFLFIDDDEAPRFDFVDGSWVRRNYWRETAATIGVVKEENPLYDMAAYDSVIFVANDKGPRSLKLPRAPQAGGNTNFGQAHSDFNMDFINYGDQVSNPLRHLGFFLGNAYEAIDPGQNRFVIVFLVRRDTGGITIVNPSNVDPIEATPAPILPGQFRPCCGIISINSCCNKSEFTCASTTAPEGFDNGIILQPMTTGAGIIEVGNSYNLLGAGERVFTVATITGDDNEIVTFGYDGAAVSCASLITAWQATPVLTPDPLTSSSSSSEEASSSSSGA